MNAREVIEAAWEARASLKPTQELRDSVEEAIAGLDSELRVAESGRRVDYAPVAQEGGAFLPPAGQPGIEGKYYDKVDSKFTDFDFASGGFRVVPPAAARRGAYIAKNVVLMPSFVNIGAYVDEGTMVDTWATVGSCAQIGKNVHLSGASASAACSSRCRRTR